MAREIPIETLLSEAGWLRQLAASLVRDSAQADDLVQDTWLAALRHPPEGDVPRRHWLARVARNLAGNTRRSELRRAEREAQRGEARPSATPETLAEEAEAQRLLAEAVSALDEPLRSVVVLRYVHELDSAAIARELAIPAGTARWRLKKALEELRQRLDRRFDGERRAWMLALGPLARLAEPERAASLAAGAPFVALVGSTVALVVAGTVWAIARRPETGAGPMLASQAETRVDEPVRSTSVAPELTGARSPGTSVPPAPPALPTPVTYELSGSVVVVGATRPWTVELVLRASRGAGPLHAIAQPASEPQHAQETQSSEIRSSASPALTQRVASGDSFSFRDLPAGWSGTLSATGFDLVGGGRSLGVSIPSPNVSLRLIEQPGLSGRILTASNEPVPRAWGTYRFRVGNLPEEGSQLEFGSLETDAEGWFHVALSDPGPRGLAALLFELDTGYALAESPEFDSALGYDFGDVLLEPTRTVSFRALDSTGEPIAGAVGRLEGPSLLSRASEPSDARGVGRIPFAPERSIGLRVSALGHGDGTVEGMVEAAVERSPDAIFDLVLERLPTLELRLLAPTHPFAALTVRIASRAQLWPFYEGESPFDEQALLGAASPLAAHVVAADPERKFQRTYRPDDQGRLVLTGLVPDLPFEVGVQDAEGRALATDQLTLGVGEWRALELVVD